MKKTKTALQEIKELIDGFETKYGHQRDSLLAEIKKMIQPAIEKEKQQIIDAWEERDDFYKYDSGRDYFEDTYECGEAE